MITYLYRLSLRHFPALHKAACRLPLPVQNFMKHSVRRRMAARNMANAAGGALIAREGRIETQGLDPNLKSGAQVVGYIKGELSLGIHARTTLQTLETMEIACGAINFTLGLQHAQNCASHDRLITQKPDFKANIFCMSAATLALCHQERGADLFAGRYNIHYAVWELAKYPAPWMPAMNLVHEMWTISGFMQQAVAASATLPAISMGIPVQCALSDPLPRAWFGLPERTFLFLFSYDIGSLSERKNPQAALRAFLEAFPKDDNVAIVIKMNFIAERADHRKEIAQLKQAWAHDPRIIFMDRLLEYQQMLSLINACDAYVSLHRAEGFGLGMAEAMCLKKPVIATGYSGNMDFTRPHNSCLVDFTLIPIKPGQFSFEEGQVWADADTAHAAHYMKKLTTDTAFYAQLAQAGHKTITEEFSYRAIGGKIKDRLKMLRLVG